jgi:hypothetical protein
MKPEGCPVSSGANSNYKGPAVKTPLNIYSAGSFPFSNQLVKNI